jgi:hypothetical protein
MTNQKEAMVYAYETLNRFITAIEIIKRNFGLVREERLNLTAANQRN